MHLPQTKNKKVNLNTEYSYSVVGCGIAKACELPVKYAYSFLSTLQNVQI